MAAHGQAVGPAHGGSKSTLIALLLGMQHPQSGRVSVDGTPIGPHNAASLRGSITTVGQSAPFRHRRRVQPHARRRVLRRLHREGTVHRRPGEPRVPTLAIGVPAGGVARPDPDQRRGRHAGRELGPQLELGGGRRGVSSQPR
ncbi:MAG: ATP-binding cassette domain-containing protein [Pseudonocardia sp.]